MLVDPDSIEGVSRKGANGEARFRFARRIKDNHLVIVEVHSSKRKGHEQSLSPKSKTQPSRPGRWMVIPRPSRLSPWPVHGCEKTLCHERPHLIT